MKNKNLLAIHIAVILFGASGVFVKMIPMSALLLTLGRALFSALALYIYVHFHHYSLRLYRMKDYFWNLLAGLFLTLHWFFFIMSIQVSTVAIGTITFAAYPLFVVFMEPYVFKEKFQIKNLLSVVMIVLGITFLIPSFAFTNTSTLGIIYGLIGSFSFAVLSLINRKLSSHYESVVITLYEQTVATCLLTVFISIINPPLIQADTLTFFYLVVYGVVFTGVAHSLYIYGLRGVKAQTASIISVLEPVYSIVLAMLFLNEKLLYQDIIGIVMIFLAVIVATFQNRLELQKESSK